MFNKSRIISQLSNLLNKKAKNTHTHTQIIRVTGNLLYFALWTLKTIVCFKTQNVNSLHFTLKYKFNTV